MLSKWFIFNEMIESSFLEVRSNEEGHPQYGGWRSCWAFWVSAAAVVSMASSCSHMSSHCSWLCLLVREWSSQRKEWSFWAVSFESLWDELRESNALHGVHTCPSFLVGLPVCLSARGGWGGGACLWIDPQPLLPHFAHSHKLSVCIFGFRNWTPAHCCHAWGIEPTHTGVLIV